MNEFEKELDGVYNHTMTEAFAAKAIKRKILKSLLEGMPKPDEIAYDKDERKQLREIMKLFEGYLKDKLR